jgi:hypothetical protein
MSVVPGQPDCITANGLDINDFKILKKNFRRQHPQRVLILLCHFATGTWALLPQQLMRMFAAMTITPLNGYPV